MQRTEVDSLADSHGPTSTTDTIEIEGKQHGAAASRALRGTGTVEDRAATEREYFDRLVAESGESWWGHRTPAGRARLQRRGWLVASELPLGPTYAVLELGAGAGALTSAILRVAPEARIEATDVSPASLAMIEQRAGTYPNVQCSLQDAMALSYEDHSFDAVIGNSILHHLEPDKCLAELFRVLRPGGRLQFFEPNQLNPQVAFEKSLGRLFMAEAIQVSPTERTFTRWTYARFLKQAGFDRVRVEPFDFLHPATPPTMIPVISAAGGFCERIPLLKEISGSLMLSARRPA